VQGLTDLGHRSVSRYPFSGITQPPGSPVSFSLPRLLFNSMPKQGLIDVKGSYEFCKNAFCVGLGRGQASIYAQPKEVRPGNTRTLLAIALDARALMQRR